MGAARADADAGTARSAAEGMRSLRLNEAEEMGHAAAVMRDSHVDRVEAPELREVVARAIDALEAAWELRLLGPRSPQGVSEPRSIDPGAYLAAAGEAA